jgi:uncharacterized damage-inducible protein DinB
MKSRIVSYVNQLNGLYNGDTWLEESFSKKLNSLSDEKAFSPSPGHNHSVAEVVSHIIEWRKELVRKLKYNSSERCLTLESDKNWIALKLLKQMGWHHLYTELENTQREIIDLLQQKDDDFLDEPLGDTKFSKEYYVTGLLHHDLYHLGQIGLILKFQK